MTHGQAANNMAVALWIFASQIILEAFGVSGLRKFLLSAFVAIVMLKRNGSLGVVLRSFVWRLSRLRLFFRHTPIPSNWTRHGVAPFFFMPDKQRVSDPYLEALFGYFPGRLSVEYCSKSLTLPHGRNWAAAYNIKVAKGNDEVWNGNPIVTSSDPSIADFGRHFNKSDGWLLAPSDFMVQPGQTIRAGGTDEDFFDCVEVKAKKPGKCLLNVTYDVLGKPRQTVSLPVEII